jgi:hypothetical protein
LYRSKNFSIARKIFVEIGNRLSQEKILENPEQIYSLSIDEIETIIAKQSQILKKDSNEILI